MLLRSTSLPNSLWMATGKDASAAHDFPAGAAELAVPPLPRVRSVAHLPSCLSTSSSSFGSPSSSSRRRLVSTISRTLSEGDLSDTKLWPGPFAARGVSSLSLEEEAVGEVDEDQMFGESSRLGSSSSSSSSLSRLLSSSGLDESGMVVAGGVDGCCATVGIVDEGCNGSSDGGGKMCGGGRGRRGDGGSGSDNGRGGNDATEAYYLQMIEANPANSLILGNYAKFLIEVRGDMAKAQQYCERAIVANPADASVLALYADLVWQTTRDATRAEGYFDRAVQVDPDDCYIMASYAKFLWDTEEEEEEEVEEATEGSNQTLSPFLHGATSPIAAAS